MLGKIFRLDWILITAVLLLLGVGLLALYSISVSEKISAGEMTFFGKQLAAFAVGIIVMFIFSLVDYHNFKSHSKIIYFLMIVVLLLVLIKGSLVRGTTGWISIGFFNFQPVEMAKVLLILSLASFITKSKAMLSEITRLVASFFITGVVILLVLLQPDFGSALVLMAILITMLFLSGIEWKYLAVIFCLGLFSLIVIWFLLADYQKNRIINFINPENDPKGSGYNVIQSMVAVGSGGLTGKGLGHGSQSQLNFLPENHTDFIFAVIVEEFGVLGSGVVIILLVIIFYRLKKIAQIAMDNLGYLIVAGSMAMFFVQVVVNIGMNIGVMPVTGIPLIFLSYGGSSLVVSFMTIGIVNNIFLVSRRNLETRIKTGDDF
ncbi:MAG: Rod shape-determining protein RodA [Candidatus Moranbacteria bacterium GW2011_GWE1_35_17]|nr:MAG: Rod shape-determining protein RodA [Candidatus Moranbacteria bacterium GW2011_GWE1_35_17]KKP84193.1 MAG: Rod shape-determining protein RodA [Candidatus Moranbacteria bacterium GW2011_GWF1_35_5]